MKATQYPRRSMLYVPAQHMRYLEKTRQLPADCFIYDLATSVPPHLKDEARQNLVTFFSQEKLPRRELWVRVNSLDSPWGFTDLQKLATFPIAGVVFPRIETSDDVTRAATALDAVGMSEVMLAAMVENPRALVHINEIASHPRISLLIAETTSLKIHLHLYIQRERTGLLYALSQIVMAGRAYDVGVIDGSHMNLQDTEGFEYTCRQGRDLGFDGRTLSHPNQIIYANEAYRPTTEDLKRARHIVEAIEEARLQGKALTLLGDRLLQPYEIDRARRLLLLDEKIRQLEEQSKE